MEIFYCSNSLFWFLNTEIDYEIDKNQQGLVLLVFKLGYSKIIMGLFGVLTNLYNYSLNHMVKLWLV